MLTKEQIEELEGLDKAATKGPWAWNLNLKSKDVSLEGHTGMCETVIDTQRWGMGGAKLRFLRDGLMVGCDQLAKAHKGRDHHKHWCADIDHPDAQIITAMRNNLPELLRGYRAYLAMREIEVDGGELPERVYIKLPCHGMTVTCTLGEAFDNAQRLAALKGEG